MAMASTPSAQSESAPERAVGVSRTDYDKFYKPMASVEDRFGETTGSIRWNLVIDVYHRKRNATVRFFKDVDGKLKVCLTRSKYNNRRQKCVVSRFTKGVLEAGVLSHMRGQPILVETDEEGVYEILAGATLCEAVYCAYEMQPENEFVLQAIEEGLRGAIILSKHTPPDVQIWVKQEHNRYHEGSKFNIVEMYDEIISIESAWANYKKNNTTFQ